MVKQNPTSTRNRKKQRKQRNRERAASLEAGLLGKTKPVREDRHVLVALTLASLVAGLLFVINCDRVTNIHTAAAEGGGVSMHGWPLVYLERRYESLTAYMIATNDNDWPFPAVPGEIREMNYRNLGIDLICCGLIVLASYIAIRLIVYRYDQWKTTWASDPSS